MPDFLAPYSSVVSALGVFGCLYLIQLVIADAVAIRSGHTPGTPVSGAHDDPLFRATRAHANTTESVGAAILIASFAVLSGADPSWTTMAVWTFVGARVVHMLAYYFDQRLLRSAAFGFATTALFVLFGMGLWAR